MRCTYWSHVKVSVSLLFCIPESRDFFCCCIFGFFSLKVGISESCSLWEIYSWRELVCFEPRHGKVSVQGCWWREERAACVREGARSGRLSRAKGRRFQVSHGLLLARRFHTCGVTSNEWRLAGVTQSPNKDTHSCWCFSGLLQLAMFGHWLPSSLAIVKWSTQGKNFTYKNET